jgi:hypothetical protein
MHILTKSGHNLGNLENEILKKIIYLLFLLAYI